jgi:ribosomal protein S18 acetylase RimI-like enzyme
MTHSRPLVTAVPREALDAVVDVFAEAFAGYPVMRYTVGEAGDVAARERRLVRLFVTRRVARGGPMYAVSNRDKSSGMNFAGAILLTTPNEPEAPPEVAQISAEAWRELGEDARVRYDEYAAASNFFAEYPPHLHLNMIGVRRDQKGSGIGRVLLDAVRELAEAERSWAGVSLTTENPRNVDLYQHFGYEVAGQSTFGPHDTWGMYLRLR